MYFFFLCILSKNTQSWTPKINFTKTWNTSLTFNFHPSPIDNYPQSEHIFFIQPAPGLNIPHHLPQVTPSEPALHLIVILEKLFCLVKQKPVSTLLELIPILRPLLYLLPQLYANLTIYVSLVRKLHIAQHRSRVLISFSGILSRILNQTDDIGPQWHIPKQIALPISLSQIRLHIGQPVHAHHSIHHHKLRGRQCQLPGKKLTHNLRGRHPPKLIELVVAFNYRVALVQVLLVLCVFQEVNELEVLDSVQKKCCVVAVGQLGNCD